MKRATLLGAAILALSACGGDDSSELRSQVSALTVENPRLADQLAAAQASTTLPVATSPATTSSPVSVTTPPGAPSNTSAPSTSLDAATVEAALLNPQNAAQLESLDVFSLDGGTLRLAFTSIYGTSSDPFAVELRERDAWTVARYLAPFGVAVDMEIDQLHFSSPADGWRVSPPRRSRQRSG